MSEGAFRIGMTTLNGRTKAKETGKLQNKEENKLIRNRPERWRNDRPQSSKLTITSRGEWNYPNVYIQQTSDASQEANTDTKKGQNDVAKMGWYVLGNR